ncbi:membrane fusion protein, adhesin transport system [Marinobacter sp. DSM 26671]|uniref:HlyD family type I secretion periplasmic adaptor subunit n=1 Tax=Marinobacter sp. DSM 26671 TaxID=1761793 RepID=UPI0008E0F1E5|nr:HlyD family type I secretion periplasmic adaptor subunit [Marinobacter sp. DSM 26671]SFD95637.1 membrane fusion protein, adhesin transport system [Marinobacter sp. DSM 26671]
MAYVEEILTLTTLATEFGTGPLAVGDVERTDAELSAARQFASDYAKDLAVGEGGALSGVSVDGDTLTFYGQAGETPEVSAGGDQAAAIVNSGLVTVVDVVFPSDADGFLEEEIAVVRPMVRDNLSPRTRLLELQRQVESARGDRDQAISAIDQASSGIEELQTEIENARAAYELRAMEELNTVVAEQSELLESLPRLRERVSRTVIRAPMEGIVSRLNFRTPGGYVNTGDTILELVPTGEDLMVQARIMPKDISRIRMDDAVRIRLSAYDSAKYGSVDGRVIRISPDAVVGEKREGQSYYLVDVAIEGELILEETGKAVTFIPGMTATVDVLSGKRTVLEYFWEPIAKVQELALRD